MYVKIIASFVSQVFFREMPNFGYKRSNKFKKRSNWHGKMPQCEFLSLLIVIIFGVHFLSRRPVKMRDILFFSVPKCSLEASEREDRAVRSWMGCTNCQVLLFGDRKSLCRTHNCRKVNTAPIPELSETGVPIISSFFQRAHEMGNDDTVYVYINADIILPKNFADSLFQSLELISWPKKYLFVGERTEVNISWNRSCIFSDCPWNQIWSRESSGMWAIDYFVHSKDTWTEVPRFLLGRYAWDNWLLHSAIFRNDVETLDLSAVVSALHPRHGYPHFRPADVDGEIAYNRILAGNEWQGGNLRNINKVIQQCGSRLCVGNRFSDSHTHP